jgi:RND family efflux transporter MFP subunit
MKNFKLITISLLAIALSSTSCTKSDKTKAQSTDAKIPVKIAQVSEKNVPQIVEYPATVQPVFKNNIAPSAPGRIRRIMVDVGSRVGAGQRIVQMDAANLANYQTQIDNLRRNYNRVSELLSVGGASQQDVDNVKVQLEQAENTLKNLNENTYLTSPISGIVTARNYDNGDMYSGQMPVLTVMQINPVKILINVSESYYSKIKVGMGVDMSFDVFPNERFNGNVSLIYPTIDERTRTFTVEIKLPNNNSKVRPGMFGRVIVNYGYANRVVVPDLSVIKQAGSGARYVYVYKDGKVTYKQIEMGQRIGNEYEILSGLSTGDQVVVAGQSKLVDGSMVEIIK